MDIPRVQFGVLLGFLEILDDKGGKADIALIASEQNLQVDDFLPILRSAQMMHLIQVDNGEVKISEKGYQMLFTNPRMRKKILQGILRESEAFKILTQAIRGSKKGSLTKEEVLDIIGKSLGSTESDYDIEEEFNWIIYWGRQALILKYELDKDTISIR